MEPARKEPSLWASPHVHTQLKSKNAPTVIEHEGNLPPKEYRLTTTAKTESPTRKAHRSSSHLLQSESWHQKNNPSETNSNESYPTYSQPTNELITDGRSIQHLNPISTMITLYNTISLAKPAKHPRGNNKNGTPNEVSEDGSNSTSKARSCGKKEAEDWKLPIGDRRWQLRDRKRRFRDDDPDEYWSSTREKPSSLL